MHGSPRFGWLLTGIAVGVLMGLGVSILLMRSGRFAGGAAPALDAPSVVRQVRRLNQLVTVKYTIQKVVALEEKKVPVGTEKILLFVQAEVSAGIDLSKLDERQVTRLPDGSFAIRLPAPQITSVTIDDQQTKVWDRRITWWTPWVPFNPDLERKARLAARDAIEKAALEMGVLEEAERSAHAAIVALLETFGVHSVAFSRS